MRYLFLYPSRPCLGALLLATVAGLFPVNAATPPPAPFPAALASVVVANLWCENAEVPLAIDTVHPGLSWQLQAEGKGVSQVAYQILVASTPEKLAKNAGDLWDSGKVKSDQSQFVPYGGKDLQSRQSCAWKVRVWDKDDQPSQWSKPANWTMGLLKSDDWSARWIMASRWFTVPWWRPGGFVSGGTDKADSPAWAQVDLGQPTRIDRIKLYPSKAEAFPLRFRIEADDDMEFAHPQVIADYTGEDFKMGDRKFVEFPGNGVTASRVRILIVKTPLRAGQPTTDKSGKPIPPKYVSAVRQLEVWSAGRNAALMRPTIESGHFFNAGHAIYMVDGMPSADDGNNCPDDACPIETAPLLRKSFILQKSVRRATLYYAAHGIADVSINSIKVDDTVLGPQFTDYYKRIVYVTRDVSKLLVPGENAVGAFLVTGWFNAPSKGVAQRYSGHGPVRLLAQLEIEFADGTRQTIATDDSWKWTRSEIVSNDLWAGYREDRRLAQLGWDKPGFNDVAWRQVALTESLGGRLYAAIGPAVRVTGQLKPVRIEGDTAVFDVYSSGWPQIKVTNGKAGQKIKVSGEKVSHAGEQMPPSEFILAKDGPAVLEPRFLWGTGPLRMTVSGLNEPLTTDNVAFQEVHADLVQTGSFHCSNPWFNTLNEAILRTHLNYCNYFPCDPMREKQGWTQDMQSMFPTAAYLTGVDDYYRRWWRDMADNQLPTGLVGSVIPVIGQSFDDWNSPWWSGMIVWLPWQHYLYYGDRRMLEDAYEPMRKYVDYLDHIAPLGAGTRRLDYPDPHYFLDANAAKERMLVWTGAGDWENPYGAPPGTLMNMTGWYHFADIVSRTAVLLGKPDDAAKYAEMARDIARRTNAKFLKPATGLYADAANNQAAQVMPLAVDLVPTETRALTFQRLIDAIHAHDDHQGCGFVAMPYLLQLLTESGQSALANKMVNQQTFPSWRTLMKDGVFFEKWHGGGAQMPSCGGAVGMWFYQSVLGIRPNPAGPGFKKFILAPQPDPATGLTEAEGWYDTAYGRIVSQWKVESGRMRFDCTVPPNTSATVILPNQPPQSVGSGIHSFEVAMP